MAIQHVRQVHDNGCFIACMAMLTGKTYKETFSLLFPNQHPDNYLFDGIVTYDVVKTATEMLQKLGCKAKKSKYKHVRSIVKKGRTHALLIIRWKDGAGYGNKDPWMCHCIVFDFETKKVLDPGNHSDVPVNLKLYAKQLDTALYVDLPKAA